MDTPELSIVVTSRNDDHGGNLKKRMRLCFNGIFALSARHKLKCELIIVEWNPPADKPKLADVLPWPDAHPYCTVRIIEVPPKLHNRYKHAAGLPLYQMIAKNVGIRRARGRMVLATNIDILFTDAMFAFLASGMARENVMYRADRYDTDGDIPEDVDIDTQLQIAKETTLRIGGLGGTWNLRTGTYSVVNSTLADPGGTESTRYPVHTNASGDFTMMARDNWFELKGHWEVDAYSFHLDSIVCYAAIYGGMIEECLRSPYWCHHIEHTAGWTPEIAEAGTLDNHLKTVAIPRISNEELDKICTDMSRLSRPLFGPNDDNWGLAGDVLMEHLVVRAKWEDRPVAQGAIGASRPLLAVPSRFERKVLLDDPEPQAGVPYVSLVAIRRDPARDALWQKAIESVCREAGLRAEVIVVDGATGTDAAARNDGARQARGAFVLFTESGVTLTRELIDLLAEQRLNPDCFYRIGDSGVTAQMTADPLAPLATAGCENFLLMARMQFVRLRGFPEIEGAAARSCALLLNMAHAEGLTQVLMRAPLAIAAPERATVDPDAETAALDRFWCETMMRERRHITPNEAFDATNDGSESGSIAGLIDFFKDRLKRVYFAEQTAPALDAYRKIADTWRPDTIVEFGCGYGLSLRTWARTGANIVSVDPSHALLREGLEFAQFDTAKTTFVTGASDRAKLDPVWRQGGKLLVVINPSLLPPSERHWVWTEVMPALPADCRVVISSIWMAPFPLDERTAYPFFANFVIRDIDPTYAFNAGYIPFGDGAVLGEGDLRPLVQWLTANAIEPQAPGSRNFIIFTVPKRQGAISDTAVPSLGRYLYDPAGSWRWRDGEFVDPLARQVIAICEAGAEAYRADDIARASDGFMQALMLYERMTWAANEHAQRMIQADDRGDRRAALDHLVEWERAIKRIGRLEGVKRILVYCALRESDLHRALDVPRLSRVDAVGISLIDAVRIQLIRTGKIQPRRGANSRMATV